MKPRRCALALTASALLAGGAAAGASALTGSSDEPARPAAKAEPAVTYNADGVPTVRSGPECEAGKGRAAHRGKRSTARH